MNTSILDEILDHAEAEIGESIPIQLLPDQIDPRLKLLSHSSRSTLHRCPRKYQLYRLNSTQIELDREKEEIQGVTFAFGHAVGDGIASVLAGKSKDQVILDIFLGWKDADLLDELPVVVILAICMPVFLRQGRVRRKRVT